jgi:ubiquinone/menaquinone biosynthesis C-methylase UbiE
MSHPAEFSGLKGRLAAWFLTSPLRRILHFKMGNPDSRFMELLELKGDEVVVDSGCGSGHHSLMVAEHLRSAGSAGATRPRVIAIDVSKEMIAKLRRNADARGLSDRIEALEADALAIPLDSAVADRAITLAAWHHFDDPQAACRELARVLKPGGRFVCVDLHIRPDKRPVKGLHGHDRSFTPDHMRRYLAEAGLSDIHVETIGRWVVGAAVKASPSPAGR